LARKRISDFLLAQTPISLRKGSQIGFVVSNVGELTLVGFAYKHMTLFRTWNQAVEIGFDSAEGRYTWKRSGVMLEEVYRLAIERRSP
jgi:hypothetical protein